MWWLNDQINSWMVPSLVLSWSESTFGKYYGHYVNSYLRDLLAGSVLYYLVGSIWHWNAYVRRGKEQFEDQGRARPSNSIIFDQIQLAQMSMVMYAALPVFSSWLIETGWTRAYWSVDQVGGIGPYLLYTLAYARARAHTRSMRRAHDARTLEARTALYRLHRSVCKSTHTHARTHARTHAHTPARAHTRHTLADTLHRYFGLVEIGIYWMHRTLHTNKFLYKHIHATHHK